MTVIYVSNISPHIECMITTGITIILFVSNNKSISVGVLYLSHMSI